MGSDSAVYRPMTTGRDELRGRPSTKKLTGGSEPAATAAFHFGPRRSLHVGRREVHSVSASV